MSNTVQALIIEPGNAGNSTIKTISTDLATLQGLVGGYIEAAYGYRGQDGHDHDAPRLTFYVNEEGKIHKLAGNALATALWWHYNTAAIGHDYLVGTVVVVGGAGGAATLPADVLDTYRRIASGEYHAEMRS